jgi:hypothetical protein
MKFVYSVGIFFLIFASIAKAAETPLIIGEFHGSGQGKLAVSDGRERDLQCHIAYNFYNSQEQFYMAYSLYACAGLNAINDQPLQAVIRGKDIFSLSSIGTLPSGTKIGTLASDGSFHFEIAFKQKQKAQNQIVTSKDGSCNKRHTTYEAVEFELEYLHRFTVRPGNNNFELFRELRKDFVTADYKKDDTCPNFISLVFEKKTSRSSISGSAELFHPKK